MIHPETIAVYNTHATPLAEYFAGIGSRIDLTAKWLVVVLRKN